MENKKAVIEIKTDGEIRLHETAPDADILTTLQGIVGGYIEVVPTSLRGVFLVVNEEGLVDELPCNPVASILMEHGSYIAGNAALTVEGVDENGERDLAPMDSKFAEIVADAVQQLYKRALLG